ncbi:uncharacterized protein LOC144444541 [Glandiceps talaboti]
MVVCKFFVQGNCRYGNQCRFEHPTGGYNQQWGGSGGGGGGGGRNQNQNANRWTRRVGFAEPFPQTQNRFAPLTTSQQSGPIDKGQILETVKRDMEEWEASKMWLFSCYAVTKAQKTLPGMDDVSPEELRHYTYEAKQEGSFAQYEQSIVQAVNNVQRQRHDLKSPDPQLKTNVIQVYLGNFNAASVFSTTIGAHALLSGSSSSIGMSSMQPGLFSSAQGSSSAGSFGSTGTTSSFGGFGNTGTSSFGGFGATDSSTSSFGGIAKTGTSSGFGGFGGPGATSSTQSSGFGGFGGPGATTSTQSSGFGGFGGTNAAGSSSSSTFGGIGNQGASSAMSSTSTFGSFGTAPPQGNTGLFGNQGASATTGTFGGFGASNQSSFGGFGTNAAPSTGTGFQASSFTSNQPGIGSSAGATSTTAANQMNAASNTHVSKIYSNLADLTTVEKEQFESKTFTLGKIPIRPPPKELI